VTFDLHPVGGRKTQAQSGIFPHHAANLRFAVFEREVELAGTRLGKVGNLAAHPQVLQNFICFQEFAQVVIEGGNGKNQCCVEIERVHTGKDNQKEGPCQFANHILAGFY